MLEECHRPSVQSVRCCLRCEAGDELDQAHAGPGDGEGDDRQRRRLVGAVGAEQLHVGAEGRAVEQAAMVNSPMTMAKVRKAPDSTATSTLGRITRDMIVSQLAPRLCAASVSVRDVDGAQARYRRRGTCRAAPASHSRSISRTLVPHRRAGQRQDRGGVVEPDIAEDDDDGRDDQRQQRDELDERPQLRQLAAAPSRRSAPRSARRRRWCSSAIDHRIAEGRLEAADRPSTTR